MFLSTKISTNTLHCDITTRISHFDKDSKGIAFPSVLAFQMPNGTKFIIEEIDASSALKDVAKLLHEGGGDSTRAFLPIELGRSFNFFFGGRSYPANSPLSFIHQEINLNDCHAVVCMATEAKVAADTLKSSSGVEWRVLNENTVMLDSSPYAERAGAVAFGESLLKEISSLAPHIDMQIRSMDRYFYTEMRVKNRHSIHLIAQGIPIEIGLAASSIAQALRNGDQAGLSMLPLDVLSRLGMFLAPGLPRIDGCEIMQAEIEHASVEYRDAPIFRKIAPIAIGEIKNSIAETASMLLRCSANNSFADGKNLKVCNVTFSNAGLTLDFNDANYAGNFIRTLRHAGYQAADLERKNPYESNGRSVARIKIKDFNEVKRFVEATCGFDENATKELFNNAVEKPRLSSQFFIQELEAIGTSIKPMSLDEKKAAAKRFTHAYLPYLDRKEAAQLSELVSEKSRPDSNGQLGSLQYLREKRGAGRIFSINNYSDNVATFKHLVAAIDGLKE